MKKSEISEAYRYKYEEECSCCGLKKQILTQEDSFPEYYTEIYTQCQCGEYIEFRIPVN
jgi:hypothetical protein